jgi:hypothetical protein
MADYSVYLLHILFVGPLLILLGLYHDHSSFPKVIWHILVILGAGIMCYHAYLAWRMYRILNSSSK